MAQFERTPHLSTSVIEGQTKKEIYKNKIRKIFFSHHGNEHPEKDDHTPINELLVHCRDAGADEHRYDIRWGTLQPNPDKPYKIPYLERSVAIAKIGKEIGLDPILVFSTPPKWAIKLYKENPEAYFQQFESFVKRTNTEFRKNGIIPHTVQLLNELNNSIYTPPQLLEALPRMADTVYDVMGQHTETVCTMLAGNVHKILPTLTSIPEFLTKRLASGETIGEIMRAQIKTLSVDFYPLFWHLPFQEAGWNPKNFFENTNHLERVLESVSSLGTEMELGEIGIPTVGNLQEQYYERFVKSLQPLIKQYNIKRIGFYQISDQAGPDFLYNYGYFNQKGKRKPIASLMPALVALCKI